MVSFSAVRSSFQQCRVKKRAKVEHLHWIIMTLVKGGT